MNRHCSNSHNPSGIFLDQQGLKGWDCEEHSYIANFRCNSFAMPRGSNAFQTKLHISLGTGRLPWLYHSPSVTADAIGLSYSWWKSSLYKVSKRAVPKLSSSVKIQKTTNQPLSIIKFLFCYCSIQLHSSVHHISSALLCCQNILVFLS